jgi:superfamily I DNA and/or RNA helicase
LKPCLLMSPLSVSQFLPGDPAKMPFDLVVFDEASQLLPEDALGAIHRGRQLVVTGDNQQLPPTTFFQQNADDGEESSDTDDLPLYESVLDACLGAGFPRKMLRWHYRSRHEHLIAFSNETYYESRLFTFPAALADCPQLGVKLHHVADGVYDRGGKRDNPREADVVAQLVLAHFTEHPDKTLGVIAFSYAQMDAIENAIERALGEQPDLEHFFQGDRLEGFFVKNLETVQGDERDVILLSVGYGRDSEGKIMLNFGPLNREGGQRRLNVAITRARQQLTVVSSIRARELNLSADQSLGLVHLQKYLDFAERGVAALGIGRPTPPAAMNGMQADVLRELNRLGYDAVPDVGCGANRVDLGVHLPNKPGEFVLGIEFDGPDYDETGTARDRDRLRPEVLRNLGWKLHPIWAPDWVFRKQEEIERLKNALSDTKS